MVNHAPHKRWRLGAVAVATVIRCGKVTGGLTQCISNGAVMATYTIHQGAAQGAKYADTVINRCRVEASPRRDMTLPA